MIFADYNSTWPLEEAHLAAVTAALRQYDGNPSSQHASGRRAKVAVEDARAAVATLAGARAQEIIFTSGATEANNLAIQGVVGAGAKALRGARPHILAGATEHPSVLELVQVLAERGAVDLQIVPVDARGVIDRAALVSMLRPETVLVAVMAVNNETGAVQPVAEIAAAVKAARPGAHVHVDAVQAPGKMDCAWIGGSRAIDSAVFSGHKIGAFKGCGALFLRAGVKLQGLLVGGGQERARRPGTENVPGILSFGLRARDLVAGDGAEWKHRVTVQKEMQQQLLAGLAGIAGAVVHGDPANGVANTVNFHVDGVAGDDLLLNLDLGGVAASSGSACSSGVGRPSHVLKAMGYSDWIALNSVRLSFGKPDDSAGDAAQIIQIIRQTVARVRGGAPDREPS